MSLNIKVLELFAGSQQIRKSFEDRGASVVSVDIKNYRNSAPDTIIMDILNFDYMSYSRDSFDFIFIGFPCETFSKASGGKHFDSAYNPLTDQAHTSIHLLNHVFGLLEWFKDADFMFENPTGAIINHPVFKEYMESNCLNLIRTFQGLYGYPTFKQTDLITTIWGLWIDNKLYRKNGIYSKQKFDNLSDNQRHSYPPEFANRIADYVMNYFESVKFYSYN
jgi:site-specific DNA-cytosine methylase